jgi:hypothetical protein
VKSFDPVNRFSKFKNRQNAKFYGLSTGTYAYFLKFPNLSGRKKQVSSLIEFQRKFAFEKFQNC